MKLLFDQNLSPELVELLGDDFPGCAHVRELGMKASDDAVIWEFAKLNDFAIVSKDSDFEERSKRARTPPKILWIQTGNCATKRVEALLRAEKERILAFMKDDQGICLLLGGRPPGRAKGGR